MPENREFKKWKFRHALFTNFDIFVVTYRVNNFCQNWFTCYYFLPGKKLEFPFFVFPCFRVLPYHCTGHIPQYLTDVFRDGIHLWIDSLQIRVRHLLILEPETQWLFLAFKERNPSFSLVEKWTHGTSVTFREFRWQMTRDLPTQLSVTLRDFSWVSRVSLTNETRGPFHASWLPSPTFDLLAFWCRCLSLYSKKNWHQIDQVLNQAGRLPIQRQEMISITLTEPFPFSVRIQVTSINTALPYPETNFDALNHWDSKTSPQDFLPFWSIFEVSKISLHITLLHL